MTDTLLVPALQFALGGSIRPILVFGPFEADENSFELRRDGQPIALSRQVLEVIFFMLKTRGRLVTLPELMQGPWRGTVVSHAAISRAIMLARRALSADGETKSIVTVHGKGYRFAGSVRVLDAAPTRIAPLKQQEGDQSNHTPRDGRFCSMGELSAAVGAACRVTARWHAASEVALR